MVRKTDKQSTMCNAVSAVGGQHKNYMQLLKRYNTPSSLSTSLVSSSAATMSPLQSQKSLKGHPQQGYILQN